MDLLAVGNTVTEVADSVKITRQTVSEWLHHNNGFQAALNCRREELWSAISDRLRRLLPKAIDVLEREIEGDGPNSLVAAVHLLKAAGIYGNPAPIGYTDAKDFEANEKEREGERRRKSMFAGFP